MTTTFVATYSVLWLLTIVQGIVILVLVRELSDLRQRAEMGVASNLNQLPTGSVAPEFSAIDLRSGESIHSSLFHGKRTILLFLSNECSDCRRLATELSRSTAQDLEGLVLYCHGTRRGCHYYLSSVTPGVSILVQDKTDVTSAYLLSGFPVAVVVDEAWRIEAYRYPSGASDVMKCLSSTSAATDDSALQPV